jgi:hypothetical protein
MSAAEVIVVTPDQLRAIVREEVRAALDSRPALENVRRERPSRPVIVGHRRKSNGLARACRGRKRARRGRSWGPR